VPVSVPSGPTFILDEQLPAFEDLIE